MSQSIVLSVLTRDRVGIIAAATRALFELDANIDAISQTVLQGYFTIILTADLPDGVSLDTVRDRVSTCIPGGELSVSIQKRDRAAQTTRVVREGDRFVLTIIGEDRPGIISRISGYMTSRGINIEDLYAYLEDERFILIGEVSIPKEQDVHLLQIDLEGLWRESKVTVRLQHVDIFTATNEIDFRQITRSASDLG
ncbi:ACT domain-containing protein [bacterium]|nr:ACT domain-containing protein [bacterium]